MERRAHLSNITPLPSSITRDVALSFLHDHVGMIELNPLVIRHSPTTPPPNASEEEAGRCTWYEITDKINYLPGGLAKGEVSYKGGFYNLPDGLQTHVFAPAGVDLQAKWKVGGNMPGEPREPDELGVVKPKDGLYLHEDTQLKCNIFLMSFVKKNLRKSHDVLVQDLIRKAEEGKYQSAADREDVTLPTNARFEEASSSSQPTQVPVQTSPSHEEVPCSCPDDLHDPMCQNFRYTQAHTLSSQTSLSMHSAREHQPQGAVLPATAARIAAERATSPNFFQPWQPVVASKSPPASISGRSLSASQSNRSLRRASVASSLRHQSRTVHSEPLPYVPVVLEGQSVTQWEQQRGTV